MSPEILSSGSSDYTDEAQQLEGVEVSTDKLLPAQSSYTDSSTAQWHLYGERISTFLQNLPRYVIGFFQQNKGPLGTIGLIVLALVTVRLTFSILDALDDIPLVAPTLELIGLGYTVWFVYRYLLQATTRQELTEDFNSLKEQVLGTTK